MEDKPEFVQEIEDKTKRNFKVTSISVGTLREFKYYCEKECGDSYAVGIAQLLKTKQLYENIVPLLSTIITELNNIKNQKNERRAVRTLGNE